MSATPPRIVLVRPKHAGNIGAAARAMKNFGLDELVLAAPRCRVDREAYALASHAGDVLDAARTVATLDEALAGVTWAVGTSANPRASEAMRSYPPDEGLATLPTEGAALVFGPEDHGLANDELDRCQALIRIPTAPYASINLGQAVNILAQRWFVVAGRPDAGATERPAAELASRDQMERMYDDLRALFRLIGYTDRQREAATVRLYRGLIDRARPNAREVAALRGLASQASWAAKRDPDLLPGGSDEDA
jgi:tRNA/rRNA methyltransferase